MGGSVGVRVGESGEWVSGLPQEELVAVCGRVMWVGGLPQEELVAVCGLTTRQYVGCVGMRSIGVWWMDVIGVDDRSVGG